MPSRSLQTWRAARVPGLNEVDAQCAASLAVAPPNPLLAEENVRGYVVLLSAHFQGYCRDLYTECAQVFVSKARRSLQTLFQTQFTTGCALDHGNPNLHNLRRDFGRFGFVLDLAAADPANPARLQRLSELNEWRNIAAHHGTVPATGLPGLADLRRGRAACDGLASSLDGIMYMRLRRMLRREPWPP